MDAKPAMERHRDPDAILNGITALPTVGEFLLTGKGFKSIYQVRLAAGRAKSTRHSCWPAALSAAVVALATA